MLILLYFNQKLYVHMIVLVVVICGGIELFMLARPSIGHTCKWGVAHCVLSIARSDSSYLISGCGSMKASR